MSWPIRCTCSAAASWWRHTDSAPPITRKFSHRRSPRTKKSWEERYEHRGDSCRKTQAQLQRPVRADTAGAAGAALGDLVAVDIELRLGQQHLEPSASGF